MTDSRAQFESQTVGVLGGGFGLYGWLPALQLLSKPTVTLRRYEDFISKRSELAGFADSISFVDDQESLLKRVDTLVIAKRPIDQLRLVRDCENANWQGNIVLEKPLAPSPVQAREVIRHFDRSGNGIAVGFSMQKTPWAVRLGQLLAAESVEHFEITWSFQAHHYANELNTWKRRVSEGGGALRFFTVHLLALVCQNRSWIVDSVGRQTSGDENQAIAMDLSSSTLTCRLSCDSNFLGPPFFRCRIRKRGGDFEEYSGNGPFEELRNLVTDPKHEPTLQQQDPRVPVLMQLVEEAVQSSWRMPNCVREHIELWESIENHRS